MEINEVCLRLKRFLRLCEEYTNVSVLVERPDYYIVRYLVVALRNLAIIRQELYQELVDVCGENLVKELDTSGLQFLIARYSCTKDDYVLKLLKQVCPCFINVLNAYC
ncbi:MAG: hypothetical protein QXL96_11775 [Ignisphaera sp.]